VLTLNLSKKEMKAELIKHDLRCGLFRWKYLLVPVCFVLSMYFTMLMCEGWGHQGNLIDYLTRVYVGIEPIQQLPRGDSLEIPFDWLAATCGILFVNLEYLLFDLTASGHQVILRSGSRTEWYLSKCLWNFVSCLIYFLGMLLTALVFTWLDGGRVFDFTIGEMIAAFYGGRIQAGTISLGGLFYISIVLPFLNTAALSMLQMCLCLYMRPVLAFLAAFGAQILAVFLPYSWMFSNGAMSTRSTLAIIGTVDPVILTISLIAVVGGSIVAGLVKIKKTDILGRKE